MAYNNQLLFSDYYLQEHMGDHPAWTQGDGLEAAFAALDEFAQAGFFPGGYTRSTQRKLGLTEEEIAVVEG